MKTLQLNPQSHEIRLSSSDYENGVIMVHFEFGEQTGQHWFSTKEAKKIGEWFLDLAKEMEGKDS